MIKKKINPATPLQKTTPKKQTKTKLKKCKCLLDIAHLPGLII